MNAAAAAAERLMAFLPYLAAGYLLLAGLYGIVTSRNLLHLIVCLGVLQSSTYVLLLAVGYKTGAHAPIFSDVKPGAPAVDPVMHALALTDVVVGATVTALLLALTMQFHKHRNTLDPQEARPLHGGAAAGAAGGNGDAGGPPPAGAAG